MSTDTESHKDAAADHAYSFWDLHRMLADSYVADTGRQRGAGCTSPCDQNLLMASQEESDAFLPNATPSNSGRRMSICITVPWTGATPDDEPTSNTLGVKPPGAHEPKPPDGDLANLPAAGRSSDLLLSLKRLHRTGIEEEESDSDSDVGNLQLHTHLCWQEGASVRTTHRKMTGAASIEPGGVPSGTIGSNSLRGSRRWAGMLHPSGSFRAVWNLMVGAFVMYDLLVTPLLVFSLPEWLARYPMSLVVEVFWSSDFVLTFFTGYYQKGFLVMERCKVARHYAKTWMLFDFTLILIDWSVDVLDLLTQGSAGEPTELSRTVRMFRLLRLVRVARALKLRRGFTAMQDVIHSQRASLYLKFFVSLGQLLMLVHWIACGWFGVTWLHSENWVASSDLRYRDSLFQYLTCVLWSFCQLGVGESPWQPTNTTEMILASVIAFTALITAAVLISTMGELIAGLRKLRQDELTQFGLLRRYLQKHDIPLDLGHRVTQFLHNQYTERQQASSSQTQVPLLELLSRPMMQELQFERHRSVLCKIGAIKAILSKDDVHCRRVLHKMAYDSLDPMVAAAGDVIFVGGHMATTSYIRMNGRLSYFKDGVFQPLNGAHWISEICLWAPWVYLGDLESQTTSEILSLDAQKFCTILAEGTDTHRAASTYARRFIKVVQRQGVYSDILTEPYGELDSLEEEPTFDMLLPAPLKRILMQHRVSHGQVRPVDE